MLGSALCLQAFCIFCGLGIKNCLLYDEVAHSAARQAVALEVITTRISDVTIVAYSLLRERSIGIENLASVTLF